MSLVAEHESSPLVTEVAERERMRASNNRNREALLILNEIMLSITILVLER